MLVLQTLFSGTVYGYGCVLLLAAVVDLCFISLLLISEIEEYIRSSLNVTVYFKMENKAGK